MRIKSFKKFFKLEMRPSHREHFSPHAPVSERARILGKEILSARVGVGLSLLFVVSVIALALFLPFGNNSLLNLQFQKKASQAATPDTITSFGAQTCVGGNPSTITFNWSRVQDGMGYEIYWADSSTFDAGVNAYQFTYTGFGPGSLTWHVRAYNPSTLEAGTYTTGTVSVPATCNTPIPTVNPPSTPIPTVAPTVVITSTPVPTATPTLAPKPATCTFNQSNTMTIAQGKAITFSITGANLPTGSTFVGWTKGTDMLLSTYGSIQITPGMILSGPESVYNASVSGTGKVFTFTITTTATTAPGSYSLDALFLSNNTTKTQCLYGGIGGLLVTVSGPSITPSPSPTSTPTLAPSVTPSSSPTAALIPVCTFSRDNTIAVTGGTPLSFSVTGSKLKAGSYQAYWYYEDPDTGTNGSGVFNQPLALAGVNGARLNLATTSPLFQTAAEVGTAKFDFTINSAINVPQGRYVLANFYLKSTAGQVNCVSPVNGAGGLVINATPITVTIQGHHKDAGGATDFNNPSQLVTVTGGIGQGSQTGSYFLFEELRPNTGYTVTAKTISGFDIWKKVCLQLDCLHSTDQWQVGNTQYINLSNAGNSVDIYFKYVPVVTATAAPTATKAPTATATPTNTPTNSPTTNPTTSPLPTTIVSSCSISPTSLNVNSGSSNRVTVFPTGSGAGQWAPSIRYLASEGGGLKAIDAGIDLGGGTMLTTNKQRFTLSPTGVVGGGGVDFNFSVPSSITSGSYKLGNLLLIYEPDNSYIGTCTGEFTINVIPTKVTIQGHHVDQNGQDLSIPGLKVTLSNGSVAVDTGYYSFRDINPGNYTVTAAPISGYTISRAYQTTAVGASCALPANPSYFLGNSVAVSLPSGGWCADVWFKYTPVATATTSPSPTATNSPTSAPSITSSPSPATIQANCAISSTYINVNSGSSSRITVQPTGSGAGQWAPGIRYLLSEGGEYKAIDNGIDLGGGAMLTTNKQRFTLGANGIIGGGGVEFIFSVPSSITSGSYQLENLNLIYEPNNAKIGVCSGKFTINVVPVSVTVQGHHVDQNGRDINLNGLKVIIGNVSSDSSPFTLKELNPGTYTVTAAALSGYTISRAYVTTAAGASCAVPANPNYTPGNTLSVSLLTGGYCADVWFKYTPNATTTSPSPSGTSSPIPTETSSPTPTLRGTATPTPGVSASCFVNSSPLSVFQGNKINVVIPRYDNNGNQILKGSGGTWVPGYILVPAVDPSGNPHQIAVGRAVTIGNGLTLSANTGEIRFPATSDLIFTFNASSTASVSDYQLDSLVLINQTNPSIITRCAQNIYLDVASTYTLAGAMSNNCPNLTFSWDRYAANDVYLKIYNANGENIAESLVSGVKSYMWNAAQSGTIYSAKLYHGDDQASTASTASCTPLPPPPSGNVPLRDTSIGVKNRNIVINNWKANATWGSPAAVESELDWVISAALAHNWSPAFLVALWGKEATWDNESIIGYAIYEGSTLYERCASLPPSHDLLVTNFNCFFADSYYGSLTNDQFSNFVTSWNPHPEYQYGLITIYGWLTE